VAGILGFGMYVPERVMTNQEWSALLDTSDEWITQRTGIKTRRFAAADQSTVDLAAAAAGSAIKDAGLSPADIDEIIVATDTPEMRTPDTASFLQHDLGCREVPAYDLGGSGCAGFVTALDVARARVALAAKHILIVGVEVITRLIHLEDRSTAVLFGDGAGAAVMGPHSGRCAMLGGVSGTDGSQSGILNVRVGGTRFPYTQDSLNDRSYGELVMDGQGVFKHAVTRMSEAVEQLLGDLGLRVSDIDLVIPHQANIRIIDAVRRRAGLAEDQVYVNVDRYGNTGSASVPLALAEAVETERIRPGDLVVLTAFGAGFHWAAAALRF
jgi:3-oxoacyl-[acyl-carrier-protein] synthase-3